MRQISWKHPQRLVLQPCCECLQQQLSMLSPTLKGRGRSSLIQSVPLAITRLRNLQPGSAGAHDAEQLSITSLWLAQLLLQLQQRLHML
jgi:hypothetical protein